MGKSVADLSLERKRKHGTLNNMYSTFAINSRVQVITLGRDFNYFDGTEEGTVVKNHFRYLGIIVKFDKPRRFEGGYTQTTFNFEPEDLKLLSGNCPIKGCKRTWKYKFSNTYFCGLVHAIKWFKNQLEKRKIQ